MSEKRKKAKLFDIRHFPMDCARLTLMLLPCAALAEQTAYEPLPLGGPAPYTPQGGPKAHPAAEATEAWRSGACPGGSGHREDPSGCPQLPTSFATCLPAGLSGPCCHLRGQPCGQRSARPWGGLV